MKFFGILAAVGVVGFSAVTAQAANVVLNLTLSVDTTAHTWQALASISGDTTRTSGLAGVEWNVAGSGGAVVNSSTLDLPRNLSDPNFDIGFVLVRNSGSGTGTLMKATQDITSYQTDGANNSVITGFGLQAQTQSGITWAQPALIGHGTYTGSTGSLTISTTAGQVTFLPNPMPTPTGAGFNTFSPDSVTGQTVPVSAIPEPASLGLLALGGVALLTRRRKA